MPVATRNFAVTSLGRSGTDGGHGKSARYIPVGNGFANGVATGNGQVPSNSSRNHSAIMLCSKASGRLWKDKAVR
jgi:hypothetical protein